MKVEELFIGKKVYSLDPTTPDFLIVESEIVAICSTHLIGIFEVRILSGKFKNETTCHFSDGVLNGDHFFFDIEEATEKYRKQLIKRLNVLEEEMKYLRLKNWELLCK